MKTLLTRTRVLESIVGTTILSAFAALHILPMAACAASEEVRPDDTPEVASTLDAGNQPPIADDAAASPDQCEIGNLCRVATPLTLGSILALAGRSKDDVWASASRSLMLHWDGDQWRSLETPAVNWSTGQSVTNLFLTPTETWGVAGLVLMRREIDPSTVVQTNLTSVKGGLGIGATFSGIAVLSDGAIYTGNAPGFVNGGKDTTITQILGSFDPSTTRYTVAAGARIPNSTQDEKMAIRSMYLVPNKYLWLVGDHGCVARYEVPPVGPGVAMALDSQVALQAAWGHDDHVWVAGKRGTILHYDGSAWNAQPSGTSVDLNAIFGVAPDDIWAAGDAGVVLHFDGMQWHTIPIPGYSGNLMAIWGSGPDDVWIGGESGMFHWGPIHPGSVQ